MPRPSADRTRSKRARNGSRRNKKHRNAHIPVCGEPHICLVHAEKPVFPYPGRPMRMRLTRCEQAWVDDVRAGRRHYHRYPLRHALPSNTQKRLGVILGLRQRINTARMAAAEREPTMMELVTSGRGWGKVAEQEARMAQARAAGLDVMYATDSRLHGGKR